MTKTAAKAASAFVLDPSDELHDLRMSEKSRPLYEHVKRFIKETVDPMSVKTDDSERKKLDAAAIQAFMKQRDRVDVARAQQAL